MGDTDRAKRFEGWLQAQHGRDGDVGVIAACWGDPTAEWSSRPMRHALRTAMLEFLRVEDNQHRAVQATAQADLR
jgi:hypothetical protein